MKTIKRFIFCLMFLFGMTISVGSYVYAAEIGDTGNTDQGDVSGSNVYTFYYLYDQKEDAIELKVVAKNPVKGFGYTNTHTFTSPDDTTVLNTSNPCLGSTIDSAITDMITKGGYDLTVSEVKEALEGLGYYDNGNGIWKIDGGYLTYVSAVKIRKKSHTIVYDANGGSGAPSNQKKKEGKDLNLRYGKPIRDGYLFKYWSASVGGNYSPGDVYTHDQDGGTVTMKACWEEDSAPTGTISAKPTHWSAGNGTVTIAAQDKGSGLSTFALYRYSYVTGEWTMIKTWSLGGTKDVTVRSYTETNEGVFSYCVSIADVTGHVTMAYSNTIYLDHSNPQIYGVDAVTTEWTNVAPVIQISTSDYLMRTTYNGSGVESVVIRDDSDNVVARGSSWVSYTVQPKYEGIHTWYITATDVVGHSTTTSVTTKYDITKPGIDGSEITFVTPDGITVSGYCQDNIINQHMDDEASRSRNHPNSTSGLSSVMLYKVKNGVRTPIYSSNTQHTWTSMDTHANFSVYYDINPTDDKVDYYLVVVKDFAGNITTKKLVSQRTLLTLFHTSIERSSYE